MGKLNTLQNSWRGHGPRPTALMFIKAFTVADQQPQLPSEDISDDIYHTVYTARI